MINFAQGLGMDFFKRLMEYFILKQQLIKKNKDRILMNLGQRKEKWKLTHTLEEKEKRKERRSNMYYAFIQL